MGVVKARDIGVKMSNGKLILFLDADDMLSPDFIEQCGKLITKNDIVYPNLMLFGEVTQNVLIENPKKIKPKDLLGHKMSIPVTSLMRKDLYQKLGGFRDLKIYEDWDFWIRAMFNGYTFTRANTLLFYRQISNSRIRQNMQVKQDIHRQITKDYEIRNGKICLKEI